MILFRPVMLCATLALGIALATAPDAVSAPKNKPKTPSTPSGPTAPSGLSGADTLLTQAKDSAEKDPLPEFGGHRAKAIKHIDHAHKHLQAAIKASSKGEGKGKGKGKGKDKGESKGKDKTGHDITKAGTEMDHALKELQSALKAYDEFHKGKGRQTGLHHAERLVRQAKAAASAGH